MTNIELDEWWSRLTIAEKERVARKAISKQKGHYVSVLYPKCTYWWMSLQVENKQLIYDHLTDDHGVVLQEWQEGSSMSY